MRGIQGGHVVEDLGQYSDPGAACSPSVSSGRDSSERSSWPGRQPTLAKLLKTWTVSWMVKGATR